MTRRPLRGSLPLHLALIASGAGGLTWEVMWQHRTALALGVSAFGTAVTLACFAGVNNLYSREFYQLVADHSRRTASRRNGSRYT